MLSTRPIRALIRGLEALTVLNVRDGATVSEVAQEIRLPRTTVYRILETLANGGFVVRSSGDDRYRLTVRVRALSVGFDEEPWIRHIARPHLQQLGHEVVWPVSISTLSDRTMLIRDSTDRLSPLALERGLAGVRLPLLTSAPGHCHLAFSAPAERESILAALAQSGLEEDRRASSRAGDLAELFDQVRAHGHALTRRIRKLVEEITVAVPVLAKERVLATLSVRFISGSLPERLALDRLLPLLKQCAARIGVSYESREAGGLCAPAQPVS
jgi:IclR family mhp operon transcriptional activator